MAYVRGQDRGFWKHTDSDPVEAGGYYGRAWGHDDVHNLKAYVLYLLPTLSAPPFFAATIYMTLSRIMTALRATHLSIFSTKWLTTVFVMVDIVCFIAFLAGASMQISTGQNLRSIGARLVLAGLIFQLLCFFAFICIAIRFHRRNVKAPGPRAADRQIKWKKHFWALYVACLSIFARNIFRAVEYTQGHDGLIARHEWFIYVFDAALIWFVMVVYVLIYPGHLAKQARKSGKGKNGLEQQELADIRSGQQTGIQPWS